MIYTIETLCGKEAFCLQLLCHNQKMSHQDEPEFLDESSTQQHLVSKIYADKSSRALFLENIPAVFTLPKSTVFGRTTPKLRNIIYLNKTPHDLLFDVFIYHNSISQELVDIRTRMHFLYLIVAKNK